MTWLTKDGPVHALGSLRRFGQVFDFDAVAAAESEAKARRAGRIRALAEGTAVPGTWIERPEWMGQLLAEERESDPGKRLYADGVYELLASQMNQRTRRNRGMQV